MNANEMAKIMEEILQEIKDEEDSFRKYQVQANSLVDFLERYTKPAAHADRGEEYVTARIESHQQDIDKYGYTFITHHDSKTGEVVSYYPSTSEE